MQGLVIITALVSHWKVLWCWDECYAIASLYCTALQCNCSVAFISWLWLCSAPKETYMTGLLVAISFYLCKWLLPLNEWFVVFGSLRLFDFQKCLRLWWWSDSYKPRLLKLSGGSIMRPGIEQANPWLMESYANYCNPVVSFVSGLLVWNAACKSYHSG